MYSQAQSKGAIKGRASRGPKIKPINHDGSIAIKFSVNGEHYKFNPIHRGKFDNELDLAKARQICQMIEFDLLAGQFDPTLDKYRPLKPVKANPEDSKTITPDYNVLELYLEFLANNNPEREDFDPKIGQTKRC